MPRYLDYQRDNPRVMNQLIRWRPSKADLIFVTLVLLWSAFWLWNLRNDEANDPDFDQLFDGLAYLMWWLGPLVIAVPLYVVVRVLRSN